MPGHPHPARRAPLGGVALLLGLGTSTAVLATLTVLVRDAAPHAGAGTAAAALFALAVALGAWSAARSADDVARPARRAAWLLVVLAVVAALATRSVTWLYALLPGSGLATALACDMTRVATLMWSNSTAGHVLSFVDPSITEGHHTIAHKGDQDSVKIAQNVKINTWYATQLAGLIDRLKAMPEGDGSVFDNTMIVWVNEQNRGNNHDRRDVPYVIAGSAGGVLNTGRYVQFDGDVGHNRFLVTLINAMGFEADSFGDPQFGTGALPGLT